MVREGRENLERGREGESKERERERERETVRKHFQKQVVIKLRESCVNLSHQMLLPACILVLIAAQRVRRWGSCQHSDLRLCG